MCHAGPAVNAPAAWERLLTDVLLHDHAQPPPTTPLKGTPTNVTPIMMPIPNSPAPYPTV